MCRNISKNLSILYKAKNKLDRSSLHTLYCSMILSYLTYACEIWGNTYESRLTKIINIQKRAVRIVDKVNYRDHSEPIFHKFKLLKFVDLVKWKTLTIMYQANNYMLPDNIQNIFNKNCNVHHHFTRSKNKENFEVKTCRTKTRSFVISIVGVKLWNDLPAHFHSFHSFMAFKRGLKNKYVEDYISII